MKCQILEFFPWFLSSFLSFLWILHEFWLLFGFFIMPCCLLLAIFGIFYTRLFLEKHFILNKKHFISCLRMLTWPTFLQHSSFLSTPSLNNASSLLEPAKKSGTLSQLNVLAIPNNFENVNFSSRYFHGPEDVLALTRLWFLRSCNSNQKFKRIL